jgi:hypothetical protein
VKVPAPSAPSLSERSDMSGQTVLGSESGPSQHGRPFPHNSVPDPRMSFPQQDSAAANPSTIVDSLGGMHSVHANPHPELFAGKTLTRREARSSRDAALVRLTHVGVTLRSTDRDEKRVTTEFHAEGRSIPELCMLVRALDVLRERRRMLVDQGVPGSRRQRLNRATLGKRQPGARLIRMTPLPLCPKSPSPP